MTDEFKQAADRIKALEAENAELRENVSKALDAGAQLEESLREATELIADLSRHVNNLPTLQGKDAKRRAEQFLARAALGEPQP